MTTNSNHGFTQAKQGNFHFFLGVEVTKSSYFTMSKIPKNSEKTRNLNYIESDVESNDSTFINNSRCRSSRPSIAEVDSSIEWKPLVELGAIDKLLTALKPDCLQFTESTETCFKEIIFRLKNLLENWKKNDKKIKNLLTSDNSLVKCEQCGVISMRKRKYYRGKYKPLERGTQNSRTQSFLPRSPRRRSENTDSSLKQVSHLCGSMAAEREIEPKKIDDSSLNGLKFNDKNVVDNKLNTKEFDKYSDRPLIEVSAPSRKTSNIPRSNARLAQAALNRRMNQRNIEIISKETAFNAKETKNQEIDSRKNPRNRKDEPKILNKSKQNSINAGNQKLSSDDVFQKLLSKLEGTENCMNSEWLEESNYFSAAENSSKKGLQNQDQLNHSHGKRLAKGDCSSFHNKEDSFPSPEIEGSYPDQLLGPDDIPISESAHWIGNEKDQSEKSNFEDIKVIDNLHTQKIFPRTENVMQSQEQKKETMTATPGPAEDIINEWLTVSLKESRRIFKENESLDKTLQSTGIQTISCSSFDIIRKMRAQITETIDKFVDCKLIEDRSNKVYKNENGTSNQENEQRTELQMSYESPSAISSSLWGIQDSGSEHQENPKQQIVSEKCKSPGILSTISLHEEASKLFSMYSNILEGNEEMDWETFEQLVETLHPTQRQLWKDICTAVKNEMKRVTGKYGASTEVCIEIKSVSKKNRRKEIRDLEGRDEIAFEMDMTLKDMENLLEKHFRSCLLGEGMEKINKIE